MPASNRPRGYTGFKWDKALSATLLKFQDTTVGTFTATAVTWALAATHTLAQTFTALTTHAAGLRINTGAATAGWYGFGSPEQVTIATGVAVITKPFVQLTSESGTTDTLDSFTYASSVAGDIVRFIPKATDTITFDNSATMLLGAATRAVAPGGYIDLQLLGTTWQERGFLTAAS